MRSPLRTSALVALAVLVVAGSVWAVQGHQAGLVERSFAQAEGIQGMLTGMLDQETALRGYNQTRRREFLEPYDAGRDVFTAELRRLRRNDGNLGRPTQRLIDRIEAVALDWRASADEAIFQVRVNGRRSVPLSEALHRKRLMDQIRALDTEVHRRIETRRHADVGFAQRLSFAVVLALAAVFGAGGWLLLGLPAQRVRRARAAEHRRRDLQSEFARTMQAMDGEREAHGLVKRHLERTLVTPSTVVVLQRNNSADRLAATTDVDPGSDLAEALIDASPSACLAVRLSTPHQQGEGDELLQCELCGKTGTERALCTPLIVSGEVIGSVLVGHDRPMQELCELVIEDTVTQAAPVLANMRNLAIAETRASTDALTGLANRRAVQDSIRRMVAHAAREREALAVVAIDVDHFKRINDRHGHDRGDDVLAAVGQTLKGMLRSTDLVGRQGGEEFIALLPDTDLNEALAAAENLRVALERLDVLPAGERVTASFGIAVMPEDGTDPASLMRQADRALYAAKANGRNRVELAASAAARGSLTAD
jgi:diguanylate cyclase (GGDEF)-like protein